MELTFEQIDGYWISEFEVSADFNLHIERDTEGRLDIYQRTAGGRYEYINDIGYLEKRLVYDYDFSALVYPKFIKIKSKVEPLICTLTTDGEVNELKYQEKTLEITSNGTTKVTADTGYNGLALVNVNVNVPQSGGGDNGSESIEYFDLRGVNMEVGEWKNRVFLNSAFALCQEYGIFPSYYLFEYYTDGSAVELLAVNLSAPCFNYSRKQTIKDCLIENGWTEEELNSLPKVTKEYFYSYPKPEE